jgi:hypothetical protein
MADELFSAVYIMYAPPRPVFSHGCMFASSHSIKDTLGT